MMTSSMTPLGSTGVRAPALALAFLLLAAPAAAQSHRAAVSVLGGGSLHGDLTPSPDMSTVLGAGWIAGMQAEWWFGSGRMGARASGLFTQRMLEDRSGDYNVYAGDLDFIGRLLPVAPERVLAPYGVVGFGLTHYAGVGGSPVIGDGVFGPGPITRPHLLVGIGTDIATGFPAGLRIEVSDAIVFPSMGESPPASGLPHTHGLVFTAGAQIPFGRLGTTEAGERPAAAERPAAERPAPVGGPRQATTGTVATPPRTTPARNGTQEQPARRPNESTRPEARGPVGTPVARESTPAPSRGGGPIGQTVSAEPERPGTLYTVQVGTFVEEETANRWAARLRERAIPVWLIRIPVTGASVNRVRVGALPGREDAERLAALLEREYGWTVRVDEVASDEPVPGDAVRATRAYLRSR